MEVQVPPTSDDQCMQFSLADGRSLSVTIPDNLETDDWFHFKVSLETGYGLAKLRFEHTRVRVRGGVRGGGSLW